MPCCDIQALLAEAEQELQPVFKGIEQTEQAVFQRVLAAFKEHRVAVQHFAPTTGYGYDDIGRDTFEKLLASALGCEDALVRPSIASGTHALATCLFGLLRPGQVLLAASGRPYDTLESVIGLDGAQGNGSLKDFGVDYRQVDLTKEGLPDLDGIRRMLREEPKIRVVAVQRSRGYAWRNALTVKQIGEICTAVHEIAPHAIVMVDNCYGEFVDSVEPTQVGADVIVGSLIKNPGGGLAPTGGYIAGKHELVEMCAYRLTSPGIGREVGSYAASYQPFYQGLFMAPHTVAQAVKGSVLFGKVFQKLGYEVSPTPDEKRSDIIQAIRFGSAEPLIAFCKAIQYASPVDSFVTPEPWAMPGYADPVIMAAGTFVAGASIELSVDAPIRPPYIGYLQGGLTYAHVKLALQEVLASILTQ